MESTLKNNLYEFDIDCLALINGVLVRLRKKYYLVYNEDIEQKKLKGEFQDKSKEN